MRTWILVLASLATSCGSRGAAPAPAAPSELPPPAVAPPAPPAKKTPPAWHNPGGMWLPEQLAEQAATLRSLGLELDPEKLGDPLAAPLAAIVSLGGCSASFVSAEGLIVTNHHCVEGMLQYNSTPEANLLRTGMLAATRADEKWAGPTQRVYVTRSYRDVTREMTDGLAAIADDLARYEESEKRSKQQIAACEKDRPGIRCRVASFFGGGEWKLVEQLELRDVRIVYAPAEGVGNFGGEIDNWRWPRHAGDYAFLRAYVGPDGKPADHAAANVPYAPPHWLRIARTPLVEGDLVLVAGYPGVTERLTTAYEAAEEAEWALPRYIAHAEQKIALLTKLVEGRPDLEIKASRMIRSANNGLTNSRGTLEALVKGGLVAQRQARHDELLAWIDADAARAAKYRPSIDALLALEAEQRATRERDAAFGELLKASSLLGNATKIVRMAEERPKADADREPGFQERDWPMMMQTTESLDKRYARELDRAMLQLALERTIALPAADQPEALGVILGKKRDAAAISAALDKLYATTKLEDVNVRRELLGGATTARLKKSKDPFVKLALALRPLEKAKEERDERVSGKKKVLKPEYVRALREKEATPIAPDANATLRVTYGLVRPVPEGKGSFTTVPEMVAKATGEEPFDAPAKAIAAAKAGDFGPYADAELGEVPVNFLSDVDTTGGNSGSPTLNARGELVGLLFDGTYESVASDWMYMEKITRSIHVDIRYVLWFADAVDGADALVKELGLEPAIP